MIYLFFVLAVLAGLLYNHAPGFTPAFGALLFCGARLKKRDAVSFPVFVLAITDWVATTILFHMQVTWQHALNLLAFAAMAHIGGLLRDKLTVSRLVGCCVAASTAYFLISNFTVWLGWGIYPHTREGLMACYVAALPYYRSSLLNTLLFAAVFFGIHEWMRRRQHDKQFAPAPAQPR